MSYILEALKKSERERKLGQVPDLESLRDETPVRSVVVARWPLAVAALVLALNAAVLGYYAWSQRDQAPVAAPAAAVAQPTAPVQHAASPVPAPAPPAPTRAAAPVVAPAVNLPPPPGPMAVAREPVPEPVYTPPAHVPAATLWEEMPLEFRSRVPEPTIDVHVYAQDPARRFILVNLKKYRQGDRLPDGARVEQITEDGVIFLADGQRFLVPRP